MSKLARGHHQGSILHVGSLQVLPLIRAEPRATAMQVLDVAHHCPLI
jgi:hypothetical protein